MIKNRVIIYTILSSIILVIGIVFICKSFSPSTKVSQFLYSYELNKNDSYNVLINENNFYESDILESKKIYISNLVNQINVNFKAKYSITANSNIYYDYTILNDVYIKYANTINSNDNVLWNKEYILKQSKQNKLIKEKGFNINDSISLNYQDYRTQAQNFKSTYNIPVEAYMELKLIINYDLEIEQTAQKKQEQSIISLKIPLLQEVFTIEENYPKIETQTYSIDENIEGTVNNITLILGFIITSIAISLIIYLIRRIIKLNNKNNYKTEINAVLKKYGEIIIEVVSPVNIDYMRIIDVKNFEQLLDIEDEIRLPILFYEIITGEKAEFIILADSVAYRYIIIEKIREKKNEKKK